MNRIIFKILLIAFSLFFISNNVLAASKTVEIKGTKLYTEEELTKKLSLNKINAKGSIYRTVNYRLSRFYKSQGYALVRIYRMKETSSKLIVFIDEGRLEQVRIIGYGNFDTSKIKLLFQLPYKVYNSAKIRENIASIKKRFGMTISVRLEKTENYQDALFQVDRLFEDPDDKNSEKYFLKKYGYRYNLIIEKPKSSKKISNKKPKRKAPEKVKYNYGININPLSNFQPWVTGVLPSIFQEGDITQITFKTQFAYSLKTYDQSPVWTRNNVQGYYYPVIKKIPDYINPRLNITMDQSSSARPDLGLLTYDYLLVRTIAEPGFNLLNNLHIYFGFGFEKDFINDYLIDTSAEESVNIEKDADLWGVTTLNLQLSNIFTLIKDRKLNTDLKLSYYFNRDNDFTEIEFTIGKFFDLGKKIVFNPRFETLYYFGDVPFYHDTGITGANFRGSTGYISRLMFKSGNDIETSIYRNYFYAGWFADAIIFDGYGITLEGTQFAAVTGPTMRFLIIDQFDFYFRCGYDYLISTKDYNFVMSFSLKNRW